MYDKDYEHNEKLREMDEFQFEWMDHSSPDNYYMMYSQHRVRKGEEIYVNYGKKSNQLLLGQSNFSLSQNKYDSLRLRLTDISLKDISCIDQLISTEYIDQSDFKKDYSEKMQSFKRLSRQVKVKRVFHQPLLGLLRWRL